ncbi:MAG: D-alanyl-D-alanine carboxypeptidase [Ruminococcaceae bacterium]|nr:D-alanyl-D-alanine carboxypeptidase [Oscillospiraceae bacterium]
MKKICTATLSLFLLFSLLLTPASAVSISMVEENREIDLKLPCKSAILIEQTTGQVLYAQNPDEPLPIASVTKIMTLLLTMEQIEKGTISTKDLVPISETAASMGGSQAYLEPGEEITLHEILKAVFVSSANDGAVALAELISGSVDAFVAAMNEKAQSLGMTNTLFCNPTGLDDGDTGHSSARDVAIMSKELLAYEEIYPYTTIWIDSIRGGAFGLANTNKLIRFYPGATGLKTGSTAKAKYCLSASAERNGLKLCAVVLAGETSAERFSAAKTLLDFGFATYSYYMPEKVNLPQVRVRGGTEETLSPLCETEGILLSKQNAVGLTSVVELENGVQAPVAKGQKLGELKYQKDGQTVFSLPILAPKEVKKMTFSAFMKKLLLVYLTGEK